MKARVIIRSNGAVVIFNGRSLLLSSVEKAREVARELERVA